MTFTEAITQSFEDIGRHHADEQAKRRTGDPQFDALNGLAHEAMSLADKMVDERNALLAVLKRICDAEEGSTDEQQAISDGEELLKEICK